MNGLRTITAMAAALRAKEVTPRELAEQALASIDRTDDALNAYLARTEDRAYAQADEAARRLSSDPHAPLLCGVPIAVKDVLTLEGAPTTAGSKILEGFVPPYTGTAVGKLLAEGAVVVGKTNCDEFAMGSSNEHSAYGPVGNPWDTSRVPGGSSGGSAATVAARTVPMALGTDTGGSIRQPASLCGVVGFKPTYGRVSRYGLIAFASSLDQIGPFTTTVEDAAITYEAIAGADPMDSTTSSRPVEPVLDGLRAPISGMKLGVPKEYFSDGIEPGVREKVEKAIAVLQDTLGAQIVEVSLPSTDLALSVYYIIAPAECSSNLARFDGIRYGVRIQDGSLHASYRATRGTLFGPEVQRRIMLGTYVLSSGYYDAYYRRAQKVRTLIAQEFTSVFEQVDALICPTSPSVAFPKGAKSDPLSMYLLDALTIPVNLAGLPGISVPCGLADGLPVGLQVIGPRFADGRVLQIAHAYEQATEWHTAEPEIAQEVKG